RHSLDYIIKNAVAEVRILMLLAGRRHAISIAPNGFVARRRTIWLVLVKELVVQRQSRSVIGYAAHRGVGRVAHSDLYLHLAEIIVDRAIEINLAALFQNHQSGRGDGFRY